MTTTKRPRPTRPPNRGGQRDPRHPPSFNSNSPASVIPFIGGKSKLYSRVVPNLDLHGSERFVEPFAGAAILSLGVLRDTDLQVRLNEIYTPIANLWTTIFHDDLDRLCHELATTEPSVRLFRDWKQDLLAGDTDTLKTFVVWRLSRNGLGVQAGAPRNDWEDRWKPETWIATMRELRTHGSRVTVTTGDGISLLGNLGPRDFAFVDPPYVGRGDCYGERAMELAEHQRLADALRDTPATWLLTNSDAAAHLYQSWCDIDEIGRSGNGTIELVITPHSTERRTPRR